MRSLFDPIELCQIPFELDWQRFRCARVNGNGVEGPIVFFNVKDPYDPPWTLYLHERCRHCLAEAHEHVRQQCLFASTRWSPDLYIRNTIPYSVLEKLRARP